MINSATIFRLNIIVFQRPKSIIFKCLFLHSSAVFRLLRNLLNRFLGFKSHILVFFKWFWSTSLSKFLSLVFSFFNGTVHIEQVTVFVLVKDFRLFFNFCAPFTLDCFLKCWIVSAFAERLLLLRVKSFWVTTWYFAVVCMGLVQEMLVFLQILATWLPFWINLFIG